MKKTIIGATLLCAALSSSCTDRFPDYNRDPYGATDEQLETTPIGGGELKGMISWIIPNQENGFQMTFSLAAGSYSGYAGMPGFVGDFATYTPRSGWVSYPFNDTFSGHLYSHFRYIANKSGEDLSNPAYAMAVVLRAAISHYVSDIYGPIPYSKVKSDKLQVEYDTQQQLYTSMLSDLQAAAEALEATPLGLDTYADYDDLYHGDLHQWARYARSLMLRMAIRISAADPDMARKYGEWAVAHGVITTNGDNATLVSKDNPLYKIEYSWTDSRVGADIVEYLKAYSDPRLAAMVQPGSNGAYIGLRTTRESLKSHPRLQEYAHTNVTATSAIPILTAAEVAFLRAEAKLLGWDVGADTPQAYYEQGVRLSFEQWGVADADDYLTGTATRGAFADPIIPEQSMSSFRSSVAVAWQTAGDDVARQRALIATQKWIALYPYNTVEAWAEWRRTGYPNLMPAKVNASGGAVQDIYRDETGRDRGGMRRLTFPIEERQQNADGVAIGLQDLGGADSYSTDLWWAK